MGESAAVAPAPEPSSAAAAPPAAETTTKPIPPPPAASVVVPVPQSPSDSSPRAQRRVQRMPLVGADQFVALAAYLCSLPLLGYGVWLVCTRDYNCENALPASADNIRVAFGLSLLSLFAASCLFTHYGPRFLYPGVLVLSAVLLGMLILGIVFVGSFPAESRDLPFTPLWLRTKIEEGDTWAKVKDCIYKSRTCQDLAFRSIELTSDDFMHQKLSPIESGCCKPPNLCGMEYVNATHWRRPIEEAAPSGNAPPAAANVESPNNSTAGANPKTFGDCLAYSNAEKTLCYDCQSCKEGFTKSVRSHRRKDGAFFVSMSVILLAVHTVRFVKSMIEGKDDTGSTV